jgi:hypothetical protein
MVTHRKELERNSLAQQLGRAITTIKQGPSRGTIIFFAVIVAAVVIYFVWRGFSNSSNRSTSERWLKLDSAIFPDQIDTLLKDSNFEGTPQERLVKLKKARFEMAQGLRDLGDLSKREAARKRISEAVDLYDDLAKSAGKVPLLHQEALWAAAKGYEALGGPDNLEEARKRYEKVLDEYKSSTFARDARKQLERLKSDSSELREINRELAPHKGP